MREIKFRVWCEYTLNGEKYTEMAGPENWFLLSQCGTIMSHGPMGRFNPNTEKQYDRLVVEFYTDLKDKNDKPLDWWEGDLFDDGGNLKTIVFQDGAFWLVWTKYPTHKQLLCKVVEWADDIRKIGNIHQNPELLEAKL